MDINEQVQRLMDEMDRQVDDRVRSRELELLIIAGMLAARSPDGILTFTFEEYERARHGVLVREPESFDHLVRFRFVPKDAA